MTWVGFRTVRPASGDLTIDEADAITKAGMGLLLVQQISNARSNLTQSQGQTDGGNGIKSAQAVGAPAGAQIWLDLSMVRQDGSESSCVGYCSAWLDQLATAGYVPGMYVAADSSLTSDDLDAMSLKYFWRSGNNLSSYPARGYCLLRTYGDPDVGTASRLARSSFRQFWKYSARSHNGRRGFYF